MSIRDRLNKKLGDTNPIPGFEVMEWLRGVRDEHYRMSIENPVEYRRMQEEAGKRLQALAKRAGKRVISAS